MFVYSAADVMECKRPGPQARSLSLRRWCRSSSPEPGPWPWAPTQAPGRLAQRKGRRNPTCNPSESEGLHVSLFKEFEGLQVGLRPFAACGKVLPTAPPPLPSVHPAMPSAAPLAPLPRLPTLPRSHPPPPGGRNGKDGSIATMPCLSRLVIADNLSA